jgi:hypothetical protein
MKLAERLTVELKSGSVFKFLSFDPQNDLIELKAMVAQDQEVWRPSPGRLVLMDGSGGVSFWINTSQIKSIKLDGEEVSTARLIMELACEFDAKCRRR